MHFGVRLVNFLKNLFSGNGARQDTDDGLYVYVRPTGCEEVIQVRLNPRNDLSQQEGGGYFVRKMARGNHRCFNPVDMTLYFSDDRKLVNHEISGGDLVDKAAHDAWLVALEAKKQAIREQNAAVDAEKEEA